MILLDTHVWLWWNDDPSRLSAAAQEASRHADVLGVSPISCWEIAMLVTKNRLKLRADTTAEWVAQALKITAVELVPLTTEAAVMAGSADFLPDHPDPADRLILATAVTKEIPLITKDADLRKVAAQYNTIW